MPRVGAPGLSRTAIVILGLVLTVLFAACSNWSSEPKLQPLDEPGGTTTAASQEPRKSWVGTTPAPAFPGGLTWFNVPAAPTLMDLRGKIVLLDFWTAGCINCQHIIPDLKRLESEFPDELVVIGVHSGKYSSEQQDETIREAIRRYELEHAVVNDADFAVWEAYGARAWPTLVLIDPEGQVVGQHAGEGVYPLFQPILEQMVPEFEERGTLDRAKQFVTSPDAEVASAFLSYPGKALADERSGRLYIADSGHNRIVVTALDGRVEGVIGSGEEGFADGAATEAEFRQPQGLSLSNDGKTLYVADTRNHAVRAVDLDSGDVSTIAGTGMQLNRIPGDGAKASETALASPWDVLAAGDRLFISMAGIHQIWVMDLREGTIGVFAGTSREGLDDGDRRTMATLAQPSGLTSDSLFLYWVDPEASAVRRTLLDGTGPVETLVGQGLFEWGDADGDGEDAQLQHPQGIAHLDGMLYVADTYNHRIRTVEGQPIQVGTLAGSSRGWSDGAGPDARFDEPAGVTAANGKLYVADSANHLVRVVDPAVGLVSTLTLSNLGVANPGPGRVLRLPLEAQTVAPGAGLMRLHIATPDGYHLNSLAPGRLKLTSSNPGIFEPGESEVSWSTDAPALDLNIPARSTEGSATLTATGQVYYCREGEEALCFIQQVEVTLPLRVAAGGKGMAELSIAMPEVAN